jgi:pantoate--beta-alanine ligase
MIVAVTRDQLWAAMRPWRADGASTALVPTMGNLHEGHLALVAEARKRADRVVTSVYVNPIQFGQDEDFDRYPRTLDADRRLLEGAGCDLLFCPDDRTIYPRGLADATRLRAAPSLAGQLEGSSRPGHFDGVVTVVARLLNLVAPEFAVFGEKDYQQLLVVRRLVEDLGFAVHVVAVPTVRGPDGLALSSRNRYLDGPRREAAARLNGVLAAAARRVADAAGDIEAIERDARQSLEACGLRVDYVQVRRAQDLGEPPAADRDLRIVAAVWCDGTRLIDNHPVPAV